MNRSLVSGAAMVIVVLVRIGQEPLDLFREYMATYAHDQASCHLSQALVRNLEVHWHARTRGM